MGCSAQFQRIGPVRLRPNHNPRKVARSELQPPGALHSFCAPDKRLERSCPPECSRIQNGARRETPDRSCQQSWQVVRRRWWWRKDGRVSKERIQVHQPTARRRRDNFDKRVQGRCLNCLATDHRRAVQGSTKMLELQGAWTHFTKMPWEKSHF